MSSFLVGKECVDNILSFLDSTNGRAIRQYLHGSFSTSTQNFGDGFDKLGAKMLKLNAEAVGQRYREKANEPTYEFSRTNAHIIQALKSLQCLIYQCSEGNIPRRKLYREMEKLEFALAKEIVYRLPEYDRAKWG